MTTGADWVSDVRGNLEGEQKAQFNRLASAYTAGSGTLTLLRDVTGVGPGTVLACGLNTLLVEAVNVTSKTCIVLGGHDGSSDVSLPSGALVRVGPRFTDHRIFRALNEALAHLSSVRTGLWAVATTEVTYDGVREGYGLTAPRFLEVLSVTAETTGPERAWPRLRGVVVQQSADTGDFPTGLSVRVRDTVEPGRAIRVTYAAAFTPLTDLSTDVSTTGLHAEAWDIPVLRASLRVMAGREIPRTDMRSQTDPRRADEVPVGSTYASTRGLERWLGQRVSEEAARLRSRYPLAA